LPANQNFALGIGENAALQVFLQDPQPISGWDCTFGVGRRFGWSSGLINKQLFSGFQNGVSGISVVNSGAGIWNVALTPQDTAFLQAGNFAFQFARVNSGFERALTVGYILLNSFGPSMGGFVSGNPF
jgi:hypothetical protein